MKMTDEQYRTISAKLFQLYNHLSSPNDAVTERLNKWFRCSNNKDVNGDFDWGAVMIECNELWKNRK